MSISSIGKTERYDFEVVDQLDRPWDHVLRAAEKKASEFVDELRESFQIDGFKFKLETVEVSSNYDGFLRTYKFVLEAKVWSRFE